MHHPTDRMVHTIINPVVGLAGIRNILVDPPRRINVMTHSTMSKCSATELHPAPN